MIGGAMVGLQSTVFKTKLGPALNGFMNYDFWLPAKSLRFDGTEAFTKKYQERAAKAGVDPLGYYMAPFSNAYLDILGKAISATKSLDDAKLADYIRKTTFKTIVGDSSEWRRGEVAGIPGAIPRYQGQWRRPVQGPERVGHHHAGRIQVRRRDLPIRKGQAIGRPNKLPTIDIWIMLRRGRKTPPCAFWAGACRGRAGGAAID